MTIPTTKQYTANQISFPFFTRFSIQLQAIYPERKADYRKGSAGCLRDQSVSFRHADRRAALSGDGSFAS